MIDKLEQDGSLVALIFLIGRNTAWHTAVHDCHGSKDTRGHFSKSEMHCFYLCEIQAAIHAIPSTIHERMSPL